MFSESFSEESDLERNYKKGDIVWVKLRSKWWPGEIQDPQSLPDDVEFKKPPLAVVKFFEEDTYEYVRNWDNINPYNCERKAEFIKKGMAAFRQNDPQMKKFPKDVTFAEVRIGGNPNILSEPEYLPDTKRNYNSDYSPSSKGKSIKKSKGKSLANITHRRFLGFDDFKAYYCIQCPEKNRIPGDREDDEIILLNKESDDIYECHSCDFSTKRLEVLAFHLRFHISGTTSKKLKKQKSISKQKKDKQVIPRKSSKNRNTEKRISKPKARPKTQEQKNDVPSTSSIPEPPKTITDIRSHLLAEWDPSDDEEEDTFKVETKTETKSSSVSDESNDKIQSPSLNEDTSKNNVTPSDLNHSDKDDESNTLPEDGSIMELNKKTDDIQQAIRSCFDFDEEDEEEDSVIIPTAVTGRKIPRIIPITERRKSCVSPVSNDNKPLESDVHLDETIEEKGNLNSSSLDKEFIDLMESTNVPELPDIKSSLKFEQNFHTDETIKFPDKEPEENVSTSSTSNEERSKSEIATKLTNPKKRFAKSFEEESSQISKKSSETATKPYDVGQASEEDNFQKLKTRIMSKIMQQANIGEDSKNKIMAIMDPDTVDADKISEDKLSTESVSKESSLRNLTTTSVLFDQSREIDENVESFNFENVDGKDRGISPTQVDEKNTFDTNTLDTNKKTDVLENIDIHVENSSKNENVYESIGCDDKMTFDINIFRNDRNTNVESVGNIHLETLNKTEIFEGMDCDETNKEAMIESSTMDVETDMNAVENVHLDTPIENQICEGMDYNAADEKPTPDAIDTQESNKEEILPPNILDTTDNANDENYTANNSDINISLTKSSESDHTSISSPSTMFTSCVNKDRSNEINTSEENPLEKSLIDEITETKDFSLENQLVQNSKTGIETFEDFPESAVKTIEKLSNSKKDLCELSNSFVKDEDTPWQNNETREETLQNEKIPEQFHDETEVEDSCSIRKFLTSEKEEFDAIEKASINLPDDAICSPPRKRKHMDVLEKSEYSKKTKIDESNVMNANSSFSPINLFDICENNNANNTISSKPSKENSNNGEISDEANLIDSVNKSDKELMEIDSGDKIPTLQTENSTIKIEGKDSHNKVPKLMGSSNTDVNVSPNQSVEDNRDIEPNCIELQERNFQGEDECKINNYTEEEIVSEVVYFDTKDVENIEECYEKSTGNADYSERTDANNIQQISKQKNVSTDYIESIASDAHTTNFISTKNNALNTKNFTNSTCKPKCETESNEQNMPGLFYHESIPKMNFNEVPNTSSEPTATQVSIQSDLSSTSTSDIKIHESDDLYKENDNMLPERQKKAISEIPCYKELPTSPQKIVHLEGNLTVVSENDLADGQVEITSEQVISSKKRTSKGFFSNRSIQKPDNIKTDKFAISKGFDLKGMEFPSEAVTTDVRSTVTYSKRSTYGRTELLDILEGNVETETKTKGSIFSKKSIVEDFCDFEDHIPSQIVCAKRLKQEKDDIVEEPTDTAQKLKKNYKIATTTTKLMERLTENKKDSNKSQTQECSTNSKIPNADDKLKLSKGKVTSSKPIIISEQIIKPATEIQKPKIKHKPENVEDVEPFIIRKNTKTSGSESEVSDQKPKLAKTFKQSGKAKILQQTIITASGEIINPAATTSDEGMFDINSMPIVLSDEILTPENMDKMPMVISNNTSSIFNEKAPVSTTGVKKVETKLLPKSIGLSSTTVTQTKPSTTLSKLVRSPKVTPTTSNRVIQKNSPLLPNTTKSGKYILVPQSSTLSHTKGIVKKMVVKKSQLQPKVQTSSGSTELSGKKVMILTNQQGQQQRLLLTPAQEKLLSSQNVGGKTPKVVKGNILQSALGIHKKNVSIPMTNITAASNPTGVAGSTLIKTNSPTVSNPTLSSITPSTNRSLKAKKIAVPNQKYNLVKQQQSSRKLQGNDEALEKQVFEQIKAIKANSAIKLESQNTVSEPIKSVNKTVTKRPYSKKTTSKVTEVHSAAANNSNSTSSNVTLNINKPSPKTSVVLPTNTESKKPPERPLHQLIIQDAVGNQTTITEGQILALPSETIDGQPQSYMLVTLDETGNLTPLNNEALMSLDPNLGLGGDVSNMVLQIEQGSFSNNATSNPPPLVQSAVMKSNKEIERLLRTTPDCTDKQNVAVQPLNTKDHTRMLKSKLNDMATSQIIEQTPTPNKETGQQLIISGDPVATQKFLESLSEGTTDLANLLANAEGNSIIIQADGQQILINTESNNQMLLPVNTDNQNIRESNPIFANTSNKSQDILAAALADTDVFRQDQPQTKFSSQLSPSNSLYPINVGNVLETSLTLSSPIMTPLEVPSTNNKKLSGEESDILAQVPKNVDLPITITDPNISQTVANQQVASLINTELQTNIELNLPISETISAVSKELHGTYSYSLPSLDDSQKTFSSSMPLLTEDVEESTALNKIEIDAQNLKDSIPSEQKSDYCMKSMSNKEGDEIVHQGNSFLDDDEEEEGRFTLGREMCSSLSEPPPEMFDLAEVNSSYTKSELSSSLPNTPVLSERSKEDEMTDVSTQAESSNDGSCEIPVQPTIVAKSQNLDTLNSD